MTVPRPDVGTTPPPGRSVALELDQRREAVTLAALDRQADIAQLTDAEFDRRIEQAQLGMRRLQRIFDTLMIDGVHYNTKQKNGRTAFPSPNLTQEGAEILRSAFRLTPVVVGDPVVIATPEFCEVTVTIAILDQAGRQIAQRTAACNSKEARFYERPRSKGRPDQAAAPIGEDDVDLEPEPDVQAIKAERHGRPLFDDAREVQDACHAMASKRAFARAIADASGIRAFLKEKSRVALAHRLAPAAPASWTQEERNKVIAAGRRAGVKTGATLRSIVIETLGYEPPHTGEDVTKILAALAAWTPEAATAKVNTERAVKDPHQTYGEDAKPAGEAPAAPAAEPAPGSPADDDLELDRRLAEEERKDGAK